MTRRLLLLLFAVLALALTGCGAASSTPGSRSTQLASSEARRQCSRMRDSTPRRPSARKVVHALSARNRRPSWMP